MGLSTVNVGVMECGSELTSCAGDWQQVDMAIVIVDLMS